MRLVTKLLVLGVALTRTDLFAQGQADAVLVADSRNLAGVAAWVANCYNESHLYFSLLTIVLIPLAGVILGGVADILIRHIGIDLKSRSLREG